MSCRTLPALLFFIPLCLLMAGNAAGQNRAELDKAIGSQTFDSDSVVRGVITSDVPIVGATTVELGTFDGMRPLYSIPLNDNTFEFRGLPVGVYQLQVVGTSGQAIYQQTLVINGGLEDVSVHITNRPANDNSSPGTISRQQLQHKAPSQARKAFEKGAKAAEKGDLQTAAGFFQTAANIDADFADAHNDLGVVYLGLGQLPKAAEEFQKAVDLAPDHNLAVANLSIVLCDLRRYREAAEAARRALKLAPEQIKMRYILGLCLMEDGGDETEALSNLQRAASEVPAAHLLVARILAKRGERSAAATQVDDYLKTSPAGKDREKLEEWLAALRE